MKHKVMTGRYKFEIIITRRLCNMEIRLFAEMIDRVTKAQIDKIKCFGLN